MQYVRLYRKRNNQLVSLPCNRHRWLNFALEKSKCSGGKRQLKVLAVFIKIKGTPHAQITSVTNV